MKSRLKKQVSDKDTLERFAFQKISTLAKTFISEIFSEYEKTNNLHLSIAKALSNINEIYHEILVSGHLYGRYRTLKNIEEKYTNIKLLGSSPYENVVEYAKSRLDLNDNELNYLKKVYSPVAANVTKDLSYHIEKKAQRAVNDIVSEGMHVDEAKNYLKETFERLGVTDKNSWFFENLARTQIAISYSAGKWNAYQDSAIDEVLWGYTYVTAGDDRVRPNHEALDGTTLPKDDPRWAEIWPPNGFACRCDVVEVFADEKHRVLEPPIDARPDQDWDINHGKVYQDIISTKNFSLINIISNNFRFLKLKEHPSFYALLDANKDKKSYEQTLYDYYKLRFQNTGYLSLVAKQFIKEHSKFESDSVKIQRNIYVKDKKLCHTQMNIVQD